MTSKERSYLRSLASSMQPVVTIGKQGLTEQVIKEINEVLECKKLIKISVLKSALREPKELIQEVCDTLKAEPIQFIGNKLIIYRFSSKKDIKHIEIPT